MSLVAQMAEDLGQVQARPKPARVLAPQDTPAESAEALPLFAAADQIQVQQKRRSRTLLALLAFTTLAIGGAGYYLWQGNPAAVTASADAAPVTSVSPVPQSLPAESVQVKDAAVAELSAEEVITEAAIVAEPAAAPVAAQNIADEAAAVEETLVVEETPVVEEIPVAEERPLTVDERLESTNAVYSQAIAQPPQSNTVAAAPAIKRVPEKSADQQLFDSATTMLRERQPVAALQALQSAFELLPHSDYSEYQQSAPLYASLLLDQQNHEQAAAFIAAYSAKVTDSSSMAVQAIRLDIAQQQYDKAQQKLDSHQASNGQNQELLTLQAALYQQQQNWQEAAVAYRQLLNIDEYRADYWMGMAVAYDAMRVTDIAKTAYQRAISLGNLKPSLQRYAMTRVAKL